jgi:hypothetical protein
MAAKFHRFYIIIVLVITACNTNTPKDNGEEVAKLEKGKELSKSYCSSCHMYSDPSMLDKETWINGALPAMGPKFGIFEYMGKKYPSNRNKPNTEGVYPSSPTISLEEWQLILDYYQSAAPDKLPVQQRAKNYTPDLGLFEPQKIPSNNMSPIITLVDITKNGGFFIYDANSSKLAKMNAQGNAELVINIPNPISNITEKDNHYLMTSIGSIYPSDVWTGEINEVDFSNGRFTPVKNILKEVERPVMTKWADLNGDGVKDILICGYGNMKGVFYWINAKTGDKNILKQVPGAISTKVLDYDKDGDMDIFTLFAQGDEQIVYFENLGSGEFKETLVQRFPSVYGSSSMQVIDVDGDNKLDIIYTSGDNADYSVILKPYHGVYIFKGDGTLNFKKEYFYPMNGAFKALAADFDEDGDMDIAAISFFADYVSQPYEGFLYFENSGKLDFKVKTFSESFVGRWLTMDVGDIDNDGDEDIILGNFSMGPASNLPEQVRNTWVSGPAAVILYNNLK